MKYLVLIQARCGSSRLPNKVMQDIAGKPDLQWVIERARRSRLADEVMVITSIENNNLPLIRLCADLGTRVFVGSEEDVLDRYYQAAKLLKPEYVIRVTGDCPMLDWRYLDRAIEGMGPETDYLGQFSDTFPDGLDLEIIRYAALRQSWQEARLSSEREHVTLYVKNHPDRFKVQNWVCPIPNVSHHRWTLDEPEDLEMIRRVYEHFVRAGREDFVTEDILAYLAEHPEVAAINSRFARNEGLAKSIANDRILTDVEVF